MPKKKDSYRSAVYKALDHVLGADEKTVFMGEDIREYGGAFGVSADLYKKYPERVIQTPISEGGFVGAAIGMAMTGYRVIVEIMFMDFLTLAMDQLVNHAANIHYMYGGQFRCPIVVRAPSGGYRGYGASHSKAIENMLMGVPGLKIVTPATVEDAYSTLISSVYDNNPVIFVEHKLLYNMEGDLNENRDPSPIGTAKVLKEGRDVTIAAHSYGVHLALAALNELSEIGVDAELIDLRSVKPLDKETIARSVMKTGRLVTVEECNAFGGVGAEVASSVIEECLPYIDGRIIRVGKADVPIPASVHAEKHVLPSVEGIVEAAKRSMSWNRAEAG